MAISYLHVVFIVAVFAIPEVIRADDPIHCYTCQSEVSLKDCTSKSKEKTCSSGTTDCATGVLTCSAGQVTKTIYYKGCATKGDDCGISKSDKPSCPLSQGGWSFSSVNQCCTGDKCNGEPSPNSAPAFRYSSVLYLVLTLLVFAVMH